ncbi:MAG: hypothetical protein DIZ78_07310 [endosymbiont of Escarpia spicata]|uniref:Uncharacterized protein n=1 Tax=endosymbiont of Escarpia spicata TaxID=2200908 RepID=A0A370DQW0_9GAMM|nr:MAG: hypothetical protein DIZ78_07310 [endosymbiont of Escarpia spicata]
MLTGLPWAALIRNFGLVGEAVSVSDLAPQAIEAKYSGAGVGCKTLAEVSKQIGVDADEAETFRQLGERYALNPIDLPKLTYR